MKVQALMKPPVFQPIKLEIEFEDRAELLAFVAMCVRAGGDTKGIREASALIYQDGFGTDDVTRISNALYSATKDLRGETNGA